MGLRYVAFRVQYALESKLGIHKKRFLTNPVNKKFISLKTWRDNTPIFFFESREKLNFKTQPSKLLEAKVLKLKQGVFTFFSSTEFNLGKDYDWITNPDTGFKYDILKHWSEIQDLSKEAGDIKYVWEKARFGFLYDVIRYDYHFNQDNSEFIFIEMESFIDKNPINQGPNYKCSQEISLRILNWTFALYFYKNSKSLTEKRFDKIINSIFWQLDHVYKNINFSRIAVRNNHAIAETLMLYLSGFLFPFIPETKKWALKGKKWFTEEAEYQIYEDGTFLQFSMNYHRVVVQLLTWGIQLSKLNNDKLDTVVYERATKSLMFLDDNLNMETGKLPNYGSNDGALFFKLTDADFRDYKSQLDDLRAVLKNEICYNTNSHQWYGISDPKKSTINIKNIAIYPNGGYYLINELKSKTFIRCGAYKDRPAQSDNLHLDIWVDGVNYLLDTGSYKYNTDQKYIDYFNGCEGHNTISVSGYNQMKKGGRFIWYNWIKKAQASLIKDGNKIIFKGQIQAFKELGNSILHTREVVKVENKNFWEIKDTIENILNKEVIQYWHIKPELFEFIQIKSADKNGKLIKPIIENKWMSDYYGVKEKCIQISFKSNTNFILTTIEINN